jgi:Bacterial transcriptional activator domain
VAVFAQLCRQAEEASDPAAFRRALALWRGPALGGLAGPALAPGAAALEEQRLNAYERCIELELAAGDHHRVVP